MVPTPRTGPSIPARLAVETYAPPGRVLDFGTGLGHDVSFFREQGYEAEGFDPATFPELPKGQFDLVMATYVFGTIEPSDRQNAVTHMRSFMKPDGIAMVSFRSWEDLASRRKPDWFRFADGWITSTCQFHRGYTPEDAMRLLRASQLRDFEVLRDDRALIITCRAPAWQTYAPDTPVQLGLTFDT